MINSADKIKAQSLNANPKYQSEATKSFSESSPNKEPIKSSQHICKHAIKMVKNKTGSNEDLFIRWLGNKNLKTEVVRSATSQMANDALLKLVRYSYII